MRVDLGGDRQSSLVDFIELPATALLEKFFFFFFTSLQSIH